jgi:hypothetical protein
MEMILLHEVGERGVIIPYENVFFKVQSVFLCSFSRLSPEILCHKTVQRVSYSGKD